MQKTFEPARALPELREALHQAARAVHASYQSRGFDVETKSDNTLLTSADLEANRILRERLQPIDPAAAWLSEENEDNATRLKSSRVWIVDPIDGTREFVEQTGEYSVSVGLAIDGVPVLGGVALPEEHRIVLGCAGVGLEVWRYDAAGHFEREAGGLGQADNLRSARILVSKSEWHRKVYAPVADELNWQPEGSIARKLALVALGRGDLTVSLFPKNEWDICGGAALILCQPGAAILELETQQPQRFNQQPPRTIGLAAGPAELVAEFVRYRQEQQLELRHSYD